MLKRLLVETSLNHPRWVVAITLVITVALGLQIPRIHIDTDPENMLPADEAVRVHHDEIKELFGLHDLLVVGVYDEDGVFEPEALGRVARLTETIVDLDGVIADDILAPSEVDDVFSADGVLTVDTLMEDPPDDAAGGAAILARIHDNPVFRGKLASDDGKVLAIFVPLETKDAAHEVGAAIQAAIDELGGDEEWHLAGVPIAEDTFGTEMFVQMAISAPLAFVILYLLMLVFFRKPLVVTPPMVMAMVVVTWTMGLLIGSGFTVHIMSSMIPIFLIPVAVLDAIHMLTEFHDRHPRTGDIRRTIRETMDELFTPMLYTSLTSAVGFGSLVLTPIPPVQVFGAFVAIGILTAWLLSMTFLVAWTVLLPEKKLVDFGHTADTSSALAGFLHRVRDLAIGRPRPLLVLGVLAFAVSVVGLTRIVVNDNPVNWFRSGHPIRVADRVMNEHLGGTYMAYLVLESEEPDRFKDPAAMRYLEALQEHLTTHENVGTTTSIADIVKKVRFELTQDPAQGNVPDNREAIAQSLFLYEISGGDPDDLWKLITPEADRVNMWVQMHAGENQQVSSVLAMADAYVAEHPLPEGVALAWAGLPYINVVWQQKMVAGMGLSLAGSAVVVFLMMTLLFRSIPLGILSMIPLTATIALVYGAIGFAGKPYDMPIAVLSALALGLSIDFAIHFLEHLRAAYRKAGDIQVALHHVFESPARAITRNVAVIAIGFVPMFFASLMPYVTVGAFFFAIMVVSGMSTLLTLPAIAAIANPRKLFGAPDPAAASERTTTAAG